MIRIFKWVLIEFKPGISKCVIKELDAYFGLVVKILKPNIFDLNIL